MILDSLTVPIDAFERRTGWLVKSEGLCKGEICVPLPERSDDNTLDVRAVAKRLKMPLVCDERHQLWSLGPEALGRALLTAEMPNVELPDGDGKPLRLRSLLGQKVLLIAWASW